MLIPLWTQRFDAILLALSAGKITQMAIFGYPGQQFDQRGFIHLPLDRLTVGGKREKHLTLLLVAGSDDALFDIRVASKALRPLVGQVARKSPFAKPGFLA